jgi:hypothetical protein
MKVPEVASPIRDPLGSERAGASRRGEPLPQLDFVVGDHDALDISARRRSPLTTMVPPLAPTRSSSCRWSSAAAMPHEPVP